MARVPVERIIDANYNRVKEGLRVCEEVARFALNSRSLRASYKTARHRVDGIIRNIPGSSRFISGRDSVLDVGAHPDSLEAGRKDIAGVFYANSQRVKEALRVLEEFSKLIHPPSAAAFKRLRYAAYALEKTTVSRMHKAGLS
jgi:thiamine-phosphate pyrophosphorylase